MKKLQQILFFLLALICVFDGANLFLGIKIPIFLLSVFIFIVSVFINKDLYIPTNILFYFILFSIVFPILSVIISIMSGPTEWGLYIKAYFFLFLLFVMYYYKLSILKYLVIMLTILSFVILSFYLLTLIPNNSILINKLYVFGNKFTIFTIHERFYGTVNVPSIYFHTSPLLIIPLGYYIKKGTQQKSIKFLILWGVVFLAMVLSGTRNNMFMAIIVTSLVYFFYGNKKNVHVIILLLLFLFICFVIIYSKIIQGFFSPEEESNSIKLSYLSDYQYQFIKIKTFLFGDGLGSFFYSSSKGSLISNSELTYFELFRRFGVFMGLSYLILMFYPCIFIFKNTDSKWLFLVYLCFLIMVFFNPFYFSSTGIIFLSEILYRTEIEKT